MNHDPLFKDKVVASDRGPAFTWYLGDYVFTRRIHAQKMEMCIEYFRELNPDYYIFSTEQTALPSGYRVIYSRGELQSQRRSQAEGNKRDAGSSILLFYFSRIRGHGAGG
ncbi:hypothetical protein [Methanothermobacter sp. THM-2]|uniref:hypothetical protein n=1 Tax=Methanothermobacter sp. THM-2 TaxID=2606912 RepID=UPI001365F30F|nr:hypothetical protein [Methanothermobacter sp. THM-2]QHN08777.1 hypothetical protein FZP68_08675 [Methanothermobacter sp. THM-2]